MFKNDHNLCIPKNTDPLKEFKGEKDASKVAFILSQIVLQRLRGKCDKDGYVQLQATEMRKVVGQDFNRLLKKTIELNWIEKSEKTYSKKAKRCNAYRIPLELYQIGLKAFKVEYRPLIRIINKIVSEAKETQLKLSRKKYPNLFDIKRFKKAHEWVFLDTVSRTSFSENVNDFIKTLEGNSLGHWTNCKDLLKMGGFDPYISQTSGRIFYIGCSFFKEAREYILISGNPTVEIDIACSQPFFVATLYENKEDHKKEKERFLKFLETDFYNSINKACGNPYKTRSDVKKASYTGIFFGNEKLMNHIELSKFLKKEFPILFWIIYSIKKNNPNPKVFKGKKKGNTFFANFLQGKEADCIFTVVEELRKLDIYCLTVHDSIIVEQQYEKIAKNLMSKIIEEKTGLKPKLK